MFLTADTFPVTVIDSAFPLLPFFGFFMIILIQGMLFRENANVSNNKDHSPITKKQFTLIANNVSGYIFFTK